MKSHNVTSERVEQLLESYGSNSNYWPEEERDKALELIKQHPHLLKQAHLDPLSVERCDDRAFLLIVFRWQVRCPENSYTVFDCQDKILDWASGNRHEGINPRPPASLNSRFILIPSRWLH